MKFITSDNQLTIKLEGLEKFWGLKSKINLPKDKIVSVEFYPMFEFVGRIWRVGGTGIPGAIYAGHFRGGGQRYYLYLHHPHGVSWASGHILCQNTLVITTENHHYKQILLTSTPDEAERVLNWWRGGAQIANAA